ncbi:MAG TPA: SGNH/GDSL hydrolase family protein [Burkholderiales bacterium]|nr:SGNH/GDSL hydrolase family protein [Burkholderiales bacterium]
MASTRFARRARAAILFAAILAGLPGLRAGGSALAHDEKASFVASWAAGHINPLPADTLRFNNQTLREVVRASIGGEWVRVRIANTFGTETLVVGEARVALSASAASVVPGTNRVLTFGGKRSIKVYAGSPVLSDPVRLDVKPMAELAVSLYLPGSAEASTTTLFQGASFVSAVSGNQTAATHLPSASALSAWPFLSGVNVSAEKKAAAIVALADSATLTSEWPRFLAERLQERRSSDHLGVVSVALAGNRMLHNSASPLGPASPNPQWGESLLTRFERDVLGQAGVQHVIVFIGLNDIAGPGAFFPPSEAVSVDDLIAGYRQLIARAHEKGLTIHACTLPPLEGNTSLPGYDTPANEARRKELNHWIRTSREFDGVIDVDRVLRDPSRPTRLLPAYDSGDHLHPNAAGGQAIADAIEPKAFR